MTWKHNDQPRIGVNYIDVRNAVAHIQELIKAGHEVVVIESTERLPISRPWYKRLWSYLTMDIRDLWRLVKAWRSR